MIDATTGQPSAYFPSRKNKSQPSEAVVPIQFPSTRNVLWESRLVGDFETLSLTSLNQDVQLFIVEKSLRLAQRYCEGGQSTSFLLGSVYPKSAEGGVCFGVDRFDPGREVTEKIGDIVSKGKVATAVVPGDHVIPIKMKNELLAPADSVSHTKDEFARSLQVIVSKICGRDSLTLSHVISLKANLYCSKKENELIIRVHCGAIVPDAKFKALPIAPLPIIPTALARNLSGPLRLSDVEGTPKMGYITMDQTRKLLLLLESDPKVYSLPLIGIWISGVLSVHHPYVWASCLRYLNCSEIKDRVLHSSGSFLLLHYSIVQRLPDFWECSLENSKGLEFELLHCREELHIDLHVGHVKYVETRESIYTNVSEWDFTSFLVLQKTHEKDECSAKDPLCFHLSPATDGIDKSLFDEAISEWKSRSALPGTNVATTRHVPSNPPQRSSRVTLDEDPRPSPSPHPSPTQGKTSLPPVPEDSLSLSFDDMASNFSRQDRPESSEEKEEILAPRFNIPAKPHSAERPSSNSKNFYKPSRPPFKPIVSPNTSVKPSTPTRKQMTGASENKENTPLTSRTVGHVNHSRKTMDIGRNCTLPAVEKPNKVSSHIRTDHQSKRSPGFENKTQNSRMESGQTAKSSKSFSNHFNYENVKLNDPRKSVAGKHPVSHSRQGVSPSTESPRSVKVHPAPVSPREKIPSDCPASCSSDGTAGGGTSLDLSTCEDHEGQTDTYDKNQPMLPLKIPSRPAHSVIQKEDMLSVENPYSQTISVTEKVNNVGEHIDSPGTLLPRKQQRDTGDLDNGKLLEEQLKKQEDMIRVLQEQVRSLLRMKETIPPPEQDPRLPLTPASTPENNDGRSSKTQYRKEVQGSYVISSSGQTEDVIKESVAVEPKPISVTTGVNTGTSLLWNNDLDSRSTCVRCCECKRASEDGAKQQLNTSTDRSNETNVALTPDKSGNSVDLSEIDIHVDSNESLPETLNVVDIPSFVDSCSSAPGQNSDRGKQASSLGESASMVTNQSASSSNSEDKEDSPAAKGREYYDKLLFQVKDLLNEHIGAEDGYGPSDQKSRETKATVQQNPPSCLSNPVPTREIVVRTTLKELEKIKHSENESRSRVQDVSSSVHSTYQRSLSTSFIPDHPRLNYVSMLVDDTFDEIAYVDEVALKYLSDKEITEFKNDLRPTSGSVKRSFTRTVRFGSLPSENERRLPFRDVRGVREVDFTWNNLSLCTKNYLTKYNLVEGHISLSTMEKTQSTGDQENEHPNSEDPQQSLAEPCKPPFPSPARKWSEDKNEILDIQRLKKLPKLF